jgi:hypothetical protein
MRHDVVFTVYRLKHSLKQKSPSLSPTLTPTPTTNTSFNYPASSNKTTVIIEATEATNGKSSAPADKTVATVASSTTPSSSTTTATTATAAISEAAFAASAGASAGKTTTNMVTSSSNTVDTANSSEHKSCIDKSWREGVDYFKVENSIVCHDGESIQGSHVTSHEGAYVLQWKHFDKLAHTHLSALDTLTAAATTHVHKAKVMYYYETLNSMDYKGSMTSLQSCQSAFSTISKHSTSGVSSGVSSSHSEKLTKTLLNSSSTSKH